MRLRILLWKDFRQQTSFLLASLILLLLPYLIVSVIFVVVQIREQNSTPWYDYFRIASIASLIASMINFSFFPANAIAGERADRSAEFFAYLPIRRSEAVLSKAIVSLALSTGVVVTCVAIMYLSFKVGRIERGPSWEERCLFVATLMAMFGIAWGVSSFATSATYAAAAGIALPICYGVTLALLLEEQGLPSPQVATIFSLSCVVVGPTCFAAGVRHYLHRVKP